MRSTWSSREAPQVDKTLACFLLSLQGHRVVAELRDDREVRGLLKTADEFMKCVGAAAGRERKCALAAAPLFA